MGVCLEVLQLAANSWIAQGGATELFKAGFSIGQIAVLGRWAAETICRDYISRGNVALDRAKREYYTNKTE